MMLYLLFLYQLGWSLACWSSSDEDSDEENKNRNNIMLDPENKKNWNGWDPPAGARDAWENWLQVYNNQMKGKGGYKDPDSPGKPYGHNIPGFPSEWADLGAPFEGMGPPPWAYVPRNTGKPSYCFAPPNPGNCSSSMTRYGYNPFINECQKFTYTGCGGNSNNFVEQLKCEQACVNPPVSGCKSNSGIPMDNFVGSK